ncbi:MAG: serine/threonine protein kinase, partial [Myxococcales bacterium]|nr:serine/threonine protein kinase [Myxococcales bacterium]
MTRSDGDGPAGPRTGVMSSAEVAAMRHPELEDAPVRARYGLEGKLGRGGMGVVVEAQDRRIGRRVAIKRLAGAPLAGAVERFVREARVQGRLHHPAIPPVYDLAIQSDGRPYFAMRRLHGLTLAEVLHRQASGDAEARARWTRGRLLTAFVDVCLALEYAHQHGVIHRDVKPSNVVLGEFGEVYVLDWGVAYLAELDDDAAREVGRGLPAELADGAGAGTTGYMPPEQLAGGEVDARLDVWALGAVLYELLAGEPLLRDAEPGEAEARIRAGAAAHDVPGDLEAV